MNSTCGSYHVTVLIAKSSEFESSRKGEIARNLKICCQQNAEEENRIEKNKTSASEGYEFSRIKKSFQWYRNTKVK